MKRLLLCLTLLGCGITEPDLPELKLWQAETEIGVTFYAEASPADSIFFRMDYLYRDEWKSVDGSGHNLVYHALVWTAEVNVSAVFVAWTPNVPPDSIWFKHASK